MRTRRPSRRFQPIIDGLPFRIVPSDLPPIEVPQEIFDTTPPDPPGTPVEMDPTDPMTSTVPDTSL